MKVINFLKLSFILPNHCSVFPVELIAINPEEILLKKKNLLKTSMKRPKPPYTIAYLWKCGPKPLLWHAYKCILTSRYQLSKQLRTYCDSKWSKDILKLPKRIGRHIQILQVTSAETVPTLKKRRAWNVYYAPVLHRGNTYLLRKLLFISVYEFEKHQN